MLRERNDILSRHSIATHAFSATNSNFARRVYQLSPAKKDLRLVDIPTQWKVRVKTINLRKKRKKQFLPEGMLVIS